MISFDTNYLIRYLLEDHAEQTSKVNALYEDAKSQDESIFISLVVLAETIWLLKIWCKENVQSITVRDFLSEVIENLLDDGMFEIENPQLVVDALVQFKSGKADFADYLIHLKAKVEKALPLYSFDKKLQKEQLASTR